MHNKTNVHIEEDHHHDYEFEKLVQHIQQKQKKEEKLYIQIVRCSYTFFV